MIAKLSRNATFPFSYFLFVIESLLSSGHSYSFSSAAVKRYRTLNAKLLVRISSLFQRVLLECSNLASFSASRREFPRPFSQSRLRRRMRGAWHVPPFSAFKQSTATDQASREVGNRPSSTRSATFFGATSLLSPSKTSHLFASMLFFFKFHRKYLHEFEVPFARVDVLRVSVFQQLQGVISNPSI